jgi:hypothetical protein
MTIDSLTPAAWRYTLHMELGQVETRLTQDRTDTPFGRRGTDYDPSYTFTEEPLYALPDASQAPRSGYSQTTEVREITEEKARVYSFIINGPLDAEGCRWEARCDQTITGIEWTICGHLADAIARLK